MTTYEAELQADKLTVARRIRRDRLLEWLVFGGALLLYLVTLAPTMLWGDDAKFQRMAYLLDLRGDEMHHPLWVAIAHLFTYLPVGDVAFRTNLVSALAAALTLVFVYKIVVYLSGSRLAGLAGVCALAVSHTFWLHAVRAEVYTLNTLFLLGLTYLLLKWEGRPWLLLLFAFLYGLSLVNHLMMAFALPGYLWLIAVKVRQKPLPIWIYTAAGLLFVLGVAPYVALVIRDGMTGRVAGIGQGTLRYIFFPTTPVRDVLLFVGFLGYQFVGAGFILGWIGLWNSIKRQAWIGVGLLLLYLGDVAFAFDLKVPDQYQFYLPSYTIFSLWIGLGTAWLLAKPRFTRAGAWLLALLVVVPVATYAVMPAVLRSTGVSNPLGVRDLPGRPVLEYHLWPPKTGNTGARDFAEAALAVVDADAIIMADFALQAPMQYLQTVEGVRPDVWVFEVRAPDQVAFAQEHADRPLYLAHTEKYYDVEGLSHLYEIVPVGPIFQLVPRQP